MKPDFGEPRTHTGVFGLKYISFYRANEQFDTALVKIWIGLQGFPFIRPSPQLQE